jgi:YegS/Rv2252/BmrU family lipid kinase
MKAFVVLNPVAGNNAREPVLAFLKTHFGQAGIDYEVHETTKKDKPGDIVRARLKKDKFDFVVAAGGDGTASEVIDGLAGGTVPLGIIPVGTGNLLARDLDLPLEIEDAVALIAGTHLLRKIDAMRINKHVCVLNASLGISATVIGDTSSKSKNRFGRLAYVWEAITNIFSLRRRYITVDVDGKTVKYRAVEAAVFNCGVLAKTLYPRGPNICIDDGHLDVWVVSFKTILDYPLYLFRMIRERPSKHLSHFINSEKSIVVRSSIPLPVQADGDIIGTTPVEIEVLPGAVTVFVSEKPVTPSSQALDRLKVMSKYRYGYSQYGEKAAASKVPAKKVTVSKTPAKKASAKKKSIKKK